MEKLQKFNVHQDTGTIDLRKLKHRLSSEIVKFGSQERYSDSSHETELARLAVMFNVAYFLGRHNEDRGKASQKRGRIILIMLKLRCYAGSGVDATCSIELDKSS